LRDVRTKNAIGNDISILLEWSGKGLFTRSDFCAAVCRTTGDTLMELLLILRDTALFMNAIISIIFFRGGGGDEWILWLSFAL
jgi:hypothetical protein